MNDSNKGFARELVVATAFVVAALLVFFAVELLAGKSLYAQAGNDASFYFYWPLWAARYRENLANGFFPLWFTSLGLGIPALATWVLTALFPPLLLLIGFDFLKAASLYVFMRLALTGVGAWLFARRSFDLSRSGAAIAALTFMLGGFAIDRRLTNDMNVLWLVPLFAMFAGEIARSPKFGAFLKLSLVTAVAVLGAHPPTTFYAFLFGGAWWLSNSISEPARARKTFFVMAGAAFVGALLASAQLIPGLEIMATFASHHIPNPNAKGYDPRGIFTAVMPWIMGDRPSNVLVAYAMPYIGVAPVALALFAASRIRRLDRRWLFPLGWAIVFLGASFGIPPFSWINRLPAFDRLANHVSSMGTIVLCVGLLAGKALDMLTADVTDAATRRRFALCSLVGAGALAAMGYAVAQWLLGNKVAALMMPKPDELMGWWIYQTSVVVAVLAAVVAAIELRSRGKISSGVAAGIIVAIAFVGLRIDYAGWKFSDPRIYEKIADSDVNAYLAKTSSAPGRFLARATSDELPANLLWRMGVEDIRCVSIFQPPEYHRLLTAVNGLDIEASPEDFKTYSKMIVQNWYVPYPAEKIVEPVGNLIGMRYAVTMKPVDAKGLDLIFEGKDGRVYENKNALPRFFLADGSKIFATDRDALNFMLTESTGWERAALFARSSLGPNAKPEAIAPIADPGGVDVVEYLNERIALDVNATARTFVMQADIYEPGWEAFVNGKPTRILKSDYLLRAIPVNAGKSEVKLRYRPASFRFALWMNIVSLLAAAGIFWFRKKSES